MSAEAAQFSHASFSFYARVMRDKATQKESICVHNVLAFYGKSLTFGLPTVEKHKKH